MLKFIREFIQRIKDKLFREINPTFLDEENLEYIMEFKVVEHLKSLVRNNRPVSYRIRGDIVDFYSQGFLTESIPFKNFMNIKDVIPPTITEVK